MKYIYSIEPWLRKAIGWLGLLALLMLFSNLGFAQQTPEFRPNCPPQASNEAPDETAQAENLQSLQEQHNNAGRTTPPNGNSNPRVVRVTSNLMTLEQKQAQPPVQKQAVPDNTPGAPGGHNPNRTYVTRTDALQTTPQVTQKQQLPAGGNAPGQSQLQRVKVTGSLSRQPQVDPDQRRAIPAED